MSSAAGRSFDPADPELRTRTILDHALDAFVEIDCEMRVGEWNTRAQAMFGWSRSEMIGKSSIVLIPVRHRAAFEADVRRALDDASWSMPEKPLLLRAIRRDGQEISVELTVARVPQGAHYGLASWLSDLSERKRLQNALREREQHESILNYIEDGYSEVDLTGKYLFVNDAYCRMYGRPREQALQASYKEFLSAENTARIREAFHAVYETGEPIRGFEFEYRAGRFTELSIALKRDGKGRPVGFVTVSRDTTARKLYERELAKAKEEAEAANKAKSEFLANMSHEIRTPMNGVIGMTGVLLETELTSEQREYAEMVRKSGEGLLTVINDILDFSKIEAGRLEIETLSFDLRAVLEEVVEILAQRAEEKSIDLILSYPASLPHSFVGDAGRIRQVVTNLVGNALKFTPRGHVLVSVGCDQRSIEGARIRVAVSDTGIGIPAERMSSLFEKFTQADASTTRKYGGTGLGLTISKQLVDLMGGVISVESEVGQGSTFSFVLPLPFESGASARPAPAVSLAGLRALIVGENEVNRRVLQEQISGWEMRCGSFASAEHALEAIRLAQAKGDGYDFIVAEHQIPGIDGAALAGWIKADPANRDTVFILLTSIGHWSQMKGTENKAIDGWLAKPVRQSQLLEVLTSSWFKNRSARIEGFASPLNESPQKPDSGSPRLSQARNSVL